jgi:serine/threonine protein kinase
MAELGPDDPVQVGKYRLLRRLGEGGMGVVYLGTTEAGYQVAVKVIAKEYAADPEFRARFAREVAAAQSVGGLYTAQVVDADTDAVAPWMASAYIPGPTLGDFAAAHGPLSPESVFRLGAALAEGLMAIHSCGLVHRDLKPGNIILADDGPRIIDFGIVRSVNTHVALTKKGTVIGTASYMSPEQAEGDPIGPPSDVFSLGSVLAYAATGHGPFDTADMDTAVSMYRVRFELPDLGDIGGPLRAVLTDCLAKDPGKRPALDDLLTRLARLATEDLARSSGAGEPTDADNAPHEKTVTDLASGEAQPTRTPTVPAKPKEQPQLADRHRAIEVTSTTLSAASDRLVSPWLQRGEQPQPTGHQGTAAEVTSVTVERVEAPVQRVAFSPDGLLLAGLARYGAPGHIYLWDVATGRLAGAPISGPALSERPDASTSDGDLLFSPDSRFLAYGNFSEGSRNSPSGIWELPNRRIVDLEPSEPMLMCTANALSPDGELFAATGWAHKRSGSGPTEYLCLWNLKTKSLVDKPAKLPGGRGRRRLIFTSDGRVLASYRQGSVRVRETAAGSRLRTIRIPEELFPPSVSASSNGRLLVIGGYDGPGKKLTVWDTTCHKITENPAFKALSAPVAFSPAGWLLAAQDRNGSTLLNTATGKRTPLALMPPDRRPLAEPLFSPDGRLIATRGLSGPNATATVSLHETATGRRVADELQVNQSSDLSSMLFSPDSRHFAVSRHGLEFKGVHWWDLSAKDGRTPLQLAAEPTPGMAFSPDSRLLAAATGGVVRIWRLSSAGGSAGTVADSWIADR